MLTDILCRVMMLISDVSLNDASVCVELTDEWTNVCWSTKQNCIKNPYGLTLSGLPTDITAP